MDSRRYRPRNENFAIQMKNVGALILLISVVRCSSTFEGTWYSSELISSRGERIYINSLNWGVTGDYQVSVITKDKKRLSDRSDTLGTVKGFEPFIYSFKNDTLQLFFDHSDYYRIDEKFNSITVIYRVVKGKENLVLYQKATHNLGYHCVPMRKEKNYPNDMPAPD